MLTSCYVDAPTFVRGAMGVETASLLGGNSALATAVLVGATSLTISDGTSFVPGPAWIFDGPNTEVVTIIVVSGATLTVSAPMLAAHAAGVNVATGGTAGALGEILVRASGWVEGFCGHGRPGNASDALLFAMNRTERYRLPGPHAVIDPSGMLTLAPLHFPVQAVANLTLDWGNGQTWALDATQIELPESARCVNLPAPLPVMGTTGMLGALPRGWSDVAMQRAGPLWVVATYTGGLIAGALPGDFVQAVCWVACHLLGYRENPTGAAERRLGKKVLVSRLRGDLMDASMLLTDAKAILRVYRNFGM